MSRPGESRWPGREGPIHYRPVESLSREEAAREAETLSETIGYYNERYYRKNQPAISDREYDRILRRLRELYRAFAGPGHVGSAVKGTGAPRHAGLERIRHAVPLYSLMETSDASEVRGFCGRMREVSGGRGALCVLEPRYVGVSVELVYERGIFRYGVTRGDGEVGENVSANLARIGRLPHRMNRADDLPETVVAQGVVYVPRGVLTSWRNTAVDSYSEVREQTVALLREANGREQAGLPLGLMCVDIVRSSGRPFASQWGVLDALRRWGLPIDDNNAIGDSFEQVEQYRRRIAGRRDELDYVAGGVVIKLDDRKGHEAMGNHDGSPGWALVWRFT
jgi:DNA ligase (NAD+)